MKLTNKQLRQIIKEELQNVLFEETDITFDPSDKHGKEMLGYALERFKKNARGQADNSYLAIEERTLMGNVYIFTTIQGPNDLQNFLTTDDNQTFKVAAFKDGSNAASAITNAINNPEDANYYVKELQDYKLAMNPISKKDLNQKGGLRLFPIPEELAKKMLIT